MNIMFAILNLVLGFLPSGQQNIPPQQLTIKSFAVASPRVVLCPRSFRPGGASGCFSSEKLRLDLRVEVAGGNEGNLEYRYSVTGGRIIGKGANVVWKFHDARPGEYVAEVRVKNRHGALASSSTRVKFEWCGTCDPELGPFPKIQVSCPTTIVEGNPATISVRLAGGGAHLRFAKLEYKKLEYKWTLSVGKIIKGDGTRNIKVDTRGLGGQKISVTVDVYGLDPAANRQGLCTTLVLKE